MGKASDALQVYTRFHIDNQEKNIVENFVLITDIHQYIGMLNKNMRAPIHR